MTPHLVCILLTIVALIGAVWLHWKNKAEQMLEDREMFFND